MTGATEKPVLPAELRAMLEQVRDDLVWWHPELHRTSVHVKTTEGGYVRHVGDLIAAFVELPDLVTVWRLAKAGLIEPAPVPSDPHAAKRPRPVCLTRAGRAALRGA